MTGASTWYSRGGGLELLSRWSGLSEGLRKPGKRDYQQKRSPHNAKGRRRQTT